MFKTVKMAVRVSQTTASVDTQSANIGHIALGGTEILPAMTFPIRVSFVSHLTGGTKSEDNKSPLRNGGAF